MFILPIIINRDSGPREPSRPMTNEEASSFIKTWFCAGGMFNSIFGIFLMFGPWWAKVVGALSLIVAGLCFYEAWKEHKDSFFK